MISFRWWGLLVVSITLAAGSWWYFNSFNENDHSVEKPMVVIIPSYNNEAYCEKNLTSVFSQQYENYRVIYIDDCSTDGMYEKVRQVIDKADQWDRVTLIRNEERMGAMANWYRAVHLCKDSEVVVNLDGDDWLARPDVLNIVNETYQDSNVWMTYGQFMFYPSEKIGFCQAFPDFIIKNNMYRRCQWVSSHLRTFYAGLFKKIKKEDFMHEGKFFPVTCDQAMMFPLLEMAGEHVKFIPEILYVYNRENPLNDGKIDEYFVSYIEHVIRFRRPYQPLESLSFA